jgi:hypothetical protein
VTAKLSRYLLAFPDGKIRTHLQCVCVMRSIRICLALEHGTVMEAS